MHEKILKNIEQSGYKFDQNPGEYNILYIEDVDTDGRQFCDRRVIFRYDINGPEIVHISPVKTCKTTLAGSIEYAPRLHKGQHIAAFRLFYYKYSRYLQAHPALIQARPLPFCPQVAADGQRTKKTETRTHGCNHVGLPNFGTPSPGAIVTQDWADHLVFITLLRSDPRYLANPHFLFSCTIL